MKARSIVPDTYKELSKAWSLLSPFLLSTGQAILSSVLVFKVA